MESLDLQNCNLRRTPKKGRKSKLPLMHKPRQAKISDFLPTEVTFTDTCQRCEEARKSYQAGSGGRKKKPKNRKNERKRLFSDRSTDSAIDTASLSSEPTSVSSDLSSDLLLSSDLEESGNKIATVSLKDVNRREKLKEFEQLSVHLTGTPLIQYTTNDTCQQCLVDFQKSEHSFQHYLIRFYGIEDYFQLDTTPLDIQDIHVNLFPLSHNGFTYRELCQSYIAPNGSNYYINKEPYMELSALPKEALIPPHDLAYYQATIPPPRQWIHGCHHLPPQPKTAHFTVMCYNVLCDKYCPPISTEYPSWSLNWDFRKRSIMEEILLHKPSILALQEVETQQFFEFFSSELAKAGYIGIFCAKSRAKTMQLMEAQTVDGCAIFWKSAEFERIDDHRIEFDQLAIANAERSENILNRVMTRDNVGLCVLLKTKPGIWKNGQPESEHPYTSLLVSTAHFVSDPAFSDVKLIQSLMLLSELRRFADKHADLLGVEFAAIPMVITGDLNSLPESEVVKPYYGKTQSLSTCFKEITVGDEEELESNFITAWPCFRSGVIEFLNNGCIEGHHPDFRSMDYQKVLQSFSHSDTESQLCHPFHLTSAYQGTELPFTNYTYEFRGVLDYIFHSTNKHLHFIDTLGPYEEQWYEENGVESCPHPHIPSDHISLIAKFQLTPSSN